jgi:CRISPR-associated protein Cmr6
MTMPLYQDYPVPESHQSPNAGLWFTKYFNAWQQERNDWQPRRPKKIDNKDKGGKYTFLEGFTHSKVGQAKELEEYCNRIQGLVNSKSGEFKTLHTVWRFVNGMGYSHPVENGFTWHHTLGVPYIPGSSLKGAIRIYAKFFADMDGDQSAHDELVKRLFGDETTVGSLIFLDATPTRPAQLEMDIINVHYSKWYEGKTYTRLERIGTPNQRIPPADWHSPVPNFFLSVAAHTPFQFGLLPRRPEDARDLQIGWTWLQETLQHFGVGAKTATGYGRMEWLDPTNHSESESRTPTSRNAISSQVMETVRPSIFGEDVPDDAPVVIISKLTITTTQTALEKGNAKAQALIEKLGLENEQRMLRQQPSQQISALLTMECDIELKLKAAQLILEIVGAEALASKGIVKGEPKTWYTNFLALFPSAT